MEIERLHKLGAELRRPARIRTSEKVETPDPADRSERHVHRTCPVDAPGIRIRADPRMAFRDELGCVALVPCEAVRLPAPHEMLAAAQLPRHLHVGRATELVVFDVAA